MKESRHTLQHTTTHCNTLQHTATRCNTLQHRALEDEDIDGVMHQESARVEGLALDDGDDEDVDPFGAV